MVEGVLVYRSERPRSAFWVIIKRTLNSMQRLTGNQ